MLTAAVGLPYIVSVIITVLAALYVLGPDWVSSGAVAAASLSREAGRSGRRIQGVTLIAEANRVPRDR